VAPCRLPPGEGPGWDFDPRLDVRTGEPFSTADTGGNGESGVMPGLLRLGTNDNEIIRVLGEEAAVWWEVLE